MARHIDPERVRRETTERVTSELLSDEPATAPEPASERCPECGGCLACDQAEHAPGCSRDGEPPYSLVVPQLSRRAGVTITATIYPVGAWKPDDDHIRYSDGGSNVWSDEKDDAAVAVALVALLRDSLAREGEERRACELGVVLVEKAVTQHIENLTKLAAAERRASEAEARAIEIEAALRLVAPYELELDGRGLCWCTLSPRLKRKHGRPVDEHDSACSRARSVLGIDNKPAQEPTT